MNIEHFSYCLKQYLRIVFTLLAFGLPAQTKFYNLTTKDGLSQNSVTHIMQDCQGMIWIANQVGLDKYEGRNIKSVSGLQKSLVEKVTGLFDWDDNHILLCTDDNNYLVYKWNPRQVSAFSHIKGVQYISKINTDTYLFFSKNRVDVVKSDFSLQTPGLVDFKKYELNQVLEVSPGCYFWATNDGLYEWRYDGNADPNKISDVKRAYALCVTPDTSVLYCAGEKMQVYAVDLKLGKGKLNANKLEWPQKGRPLSNPVITSLLAPRSNELWIGTEKNGLLVDTIDVAKFQVTAYGRYHPEQSYHHNNHFSSGEVNCMLRSKDGVVWVGADVGGINILKNGGFSFVNPPMSQATHLSMGSDIWSICVDDSGRKVLAGGRNSGIAVWDIQNNKIKGVFSPDDTTGRGRSVFVLRPQGNRLVIGTDAGLFEMEWPLQTDRGKYRRALRLLPNAAKEPGVSILEYNPREQSWLAGKRGGDTLYRLDQALKTVRVMPHIFPEEGENLSFIQPLTDFTLVGSHRNLYQYDYKKDKVIRWDLNGISPNIHFTCAWQSGDTLWLGTNKKGLYAVSIKGQKVIAHYDERSEMPAEVIYNLQPDKEGDLWLSTNHGLYQYLKSTKDFNHFDLENGLHVYEYNSGATARSLSGLIFFGGIDGLNYFDGAAPNTLDTIPFKLLVQARYAGADDTLALMVDYNAQQPRTYIPLPYQIGYFEIMPLLGDYRDVENNHFIVVFDGDTIPAREDGRYIIPAANIGWLRLHELGIYYRTANSSWQFRSTIEVDRLFWERSNWPAFVLILCSLIFGFLVWREIRNNRKLNLLHKKINEVSALDSIDDICNTATNHLVHDLKYEYALIALIDFETKIIKAKYLNDAGITAAQREQWKALSGYSIEDADILSQVSKRSKPVVVIGKEHISDDSINRSENLFNKDIFTAYNHKRFARVFIPIIHRSKSIGGEKKEEELIVGVAEVGFRLNTWLSQYLIPFWEPILAQAYRNPIHRFWRRFKNQQLRLQLYIDNLAQPYYKAYTKAKEGQIQHYIDTLEKEADKKGLDHIGFLQYAMEALTKRIGADYGDISLTTFNAQEIDFQDHNLVHGYAREAALHHATVVADKNKSKTGIINHVATTKQLYWTDNVSQDDKYIELVPDVRSELALPMLLKGNYMVGVFNLMSKKKGFFNAILADIYQRGLEKLTEIYIQKKQYTSLRKIDAPLRAFAQTEEGLYHNIVQSLEDYFKSDYISVWKRESPESANFILLEKAMRSEFYDCYKQMQFVTKDIPPGYEAQNVRGKMVELIKVNDIKKPDNSIYKFCKKHEFDNYISIKIVVDDKYQSFINVFSKREIHEEEVSGYSSLFLNEIAKKVALALGNIRLTGSVNTISNSLAKREEKDTLQLIVDQAYRMSPSAYSVVLFPYNKAEEIRLKHAIVGGNPSPDSVSDPERPVAFANYFIQSDKEAEWIEEEAMFLEILNKVNNGIILRDSYWDKHKLKSIAVIKLVHGNEPVGIMFFNYTEPKKFKDGNIRQFIEAFTNFAKIALINETYIQRIQAERNKVSEERNLLAESQAALKIEADKLKKEKDKLEIRYHDNQQLLEEILPRAAGASFFLILQGINHDIRTMLLEMQIDIEDFKEELPDKYQATAIGFENQVKNNTQKITTLLNLFNPNQHEMKEAIVIKEVIEDVLAFFKNNQSAAVHFKRHYDPDLPHLICNKTEFSMIIYNLIKNGIQAIPKDRPGEIKVNVQFKDKHYYITVEDNGIGIENENLDKVFDLRYTTKPGGIGIGLYFVKETIESNFYGRIWAKSHKGKGTIFYIAIPEYINYKN